MRNLTFATAVLFSTCVLGCTDDGDDVGARTEVEGSALYRDAETDHDGVAREADAPPAQQATLEVLVRGTGELPELDPRCAQDPAGEFQALFDGDLSVGDDGVYLATLGEAAAAIETPSGCELPDLEVGLITEVVIRAELEATTANCQTYCAASGRADAEAECGADAGAAACRASAEADAAAACTTSCTTQSEVIVAEVSLGATALGALDGDALRAAALGELHADLTFDRLE